MRRGIGRSGGRGRWPGNGPFRDLPPWERPGWLYGRGSCWYMGYQTGYSGPIGSVVTPAASDDIQILKQQKNLLESQLAALRESLARIEKRLQEIEAK